MLWIVSSPTGFAGSATDNLEDVYTDTEAFDGGPGSTINTKPHLTNPAGEVPEVEEPVPVETSMDESSEAEETEEEDEATDTSVESVTDSSESE